MSLPTADVWISRYKSTSKETGEPFTSAILYIARPNYPGGYTQGYDGKIIVLASRQASDRIVTKFNTNPAFEFQRKGWDYVDDHYIGRLTWAVGYKAGESCPLEDYVKREYYAGGSEAWGSLSLRGRQKQFRDLLWRCLVDKVLDRGIIIVDPMDIRTSPIIIKNVNDRRSGYCPAPQPGFQAYPPIHQPPQPFPFYQEPQDLETRLRARQNRSSQSYYRRMNK